MKFEYTNGPSFSAGTTNAEVPTIDLHECIKIFADIHGNILKTFRGYPVRVVPELEANEWFVGISEEMFWELENA